MRISGTRRKHAQTLAGLDVLVLPILKVVRRRWVALALGEAGADTFVRVGEDKSQFPHDGVGRARTVR